MMKSSDNEYLSKGHDNITVVLVNKHDEFDSMPSLNYVTSFIRPLGKYVMESSRREFFVCSRLFVFSSRKKTKNRRRQAIETTSVRINIDLTIRQKTECERNKEKDDNDDIEEKERKKENQNGKEEEEGELHLQD
jgi:hypothetical protein